MSFASETLDSWDTLWDKLYDYSKRPLWIYRGQQSADWHLETSLERCCQRQDIPASKRSQVEIKLIREFRRAYHQYASHLPSPLAALEWLSLMQHHGAPTRLLDFTYSIYVAAYFAMEAATEDCVVWAVDGQWAMAASIRAMTAKGKKDAALWPKPFEEKDDHLFGKIFLKKPYVRSACPSNPFRLNERLRIQKGIFLVPGDISASFEDNLQALPGHDKKDHVIKIIIPSSLRHAALRELFNMNISRTSLFPGLDGFAQSLNVFHTVFEPITWDTKS